MEDKVNDYLKIAVIVAIYILGFIFFTLDSINKRDDVAASYYLLSTMSFCCAIASSIQNLKIAKITSIALAIPSLLLLILLATTGETGCAMALLTGSAVTIFLLTYISKKGKENLEDEEEEEEEEDCGFDYQGYEDEEPDMTDEK